MVTTIDDTTSTLTYLQSEIGNLDNASKPSDAIKIKTLLSSLELEYKSILAVLKVSNTTSFKDIISKLKKAEELRNNPRRPESSTLYKYK